MTGNEKYFEQKFKECSAFLQAKPKDIVSLKYRDYRDSHYYTELLVQLNNISGLNVNNIGHAMNGKAYYISYGGQSIILVEHETGLEILYIAGSIASLIGLVLQISSMISNHRRKIPPFSHDMSDAEIRYFDKKGNFVEEHRPNYLPYEIFLLPQPNNQEIELLKLRLDNIEKKIKRTTNKPKNKRLKNNK